MTGRRGTRTEQRVEFGDWQTPDILADAVLEVACRAPLDEPACVLEPTCGEGAFLVAAASRFPRAQLVGFDISAKYVATALRRLPHERTKVDVASFFDLSWTQVLEGLAEPLLIVGNPPWVTNSALGALEAGNVPPKANIKGHSGLDAMTGKSNFDISEWMLMRLLDAVFGRRFTMAMLCKASVARQLMEYIARRGWPLEGEVRAIDARLHFAAAVDAVMLRVVGSGDANRQAPDVRWPVYASMTAPEPAAVMGIVEGRLCSDVEAFKGTRDLEGTCEIEWRSGLKHDCSKVMELDLASDGLMNGLGEAVEIEGDYVYPLLKGSDIANGRVEPRRAVIVTQRRLGGDTLQLRTLAPKLWNYLDAHRELLAARKSSIYREQPPFAIFGVGEYSFASYKVAICGMYKQLTFSVVRPVGGRPVMVDDTAYFIPCSTEEEAESLAAVLGGAQARAFFHARVFWDAKRPIGKALLQSISLEKLLRAEGRVPGRHLVKAHQHELAF